MDEKKEIEPKPKLIAKRDFHIVCNENDIVIKKGDDVSKVPKIFMENLKTEGII